MEYVLGTSQASQAEAPCPGGIASRHHHSTSVLHGANASELRACSTSSHLRVQLAFQKLWAERQCKEDCGTGSLFFYSYILLGPSSKCLQNVYKSAHIRPGGVVGSGSDTVQRNICQRLSSWCNGFDPVTEGPQKLCIFAA